MSHTYFFVTLFSATGELAVTSDSVWQSQVETLWEMNMAADAHVRADEYCLRGNCLYAIAAVAGDPGTAEPLLQAALSRFEDMCRSSPARPASMPQVWRDTRKIRRLANRKELTNVRNFIVQCILHAELTDLGINDD